MLIEAGVLATGTVVVVAEYGPPLVQALGNALDHLVTATPKDAWKEYRHGRKRPGIERIDEPMGPYAQWEAHTGGRGSPALKLDGTWKHVPKGAKPPSVPRATLEWLKEHGWNIP